MCSSRAGEIRLRDEWLRVPSVFELARVCGDPPALASPLVLAARPSAEDVRSRSTDRTGLPEQAWQAVGRWLDENDAALNTEKPRDHAFPFGFLDDEASRGFLYRQYERAKQGLDDGYALGQTARPVDTDRSARSGGARIPGRS